MHGLVDVLAYRFGDGLGRLTFLGALWFAGILVCIRAASFPYDARRRFLGPAIVLFFASFVATNRLWDKYLLPILPCFAVAASLILVPRERGRESTHAL